MNAMARIILMLLIALTAAAAAQSARMSRIGETVLHGRRAVTLENDRFPISPQESVENMEAFERPAGLVR
jgi:hypothetical protein